MRSEDLLYYQTHMSVETFVNMVGDKYIICWWIVKAFYDIKQRISQNELKNNMIYPKNLDGNIDDCLWIYRVIQNKVAKIKGKSKHTNRIKNHIGTWGRKHHPIQLEGVENYM